MKRHSIAIVILSTMGLAACHHDDAKQAPASTQYAHITCWSGNEPYVYNGDTAAGQPLLIDSSGVDFREAKTDQHIHIYGAACRVEYHDQ